MIKDIKKTKPTLTQTEVQNRFNKYNLILLETYKQSRIKVRTKCHCGNEFLAEPQNVFQGRCMSCGCIHKKQAKLNSINSRDKLWKGFGEISGIYWNKIKSGSGQRSETKFIEFNITIEYAWELFLKQNRKCALSGIELMFSSSYSKNGTLQTASLDRIDPTRGYIVGNVQWVHKSVNLAKHYMDNEEFIELCNKICNYNKKTGD
jgi:hypothetical protein